MDIIIFSFLLIILITSFLRIKNRRVDNNLEASSITVRIPPKENNSFMIGFVKSKVENDSEYKDDKRNNEGYSYYHINFGNTRPHVSGYMKKE